MLTRKQTVIELEANLDCKGRYEKKIACLEIKDCLRVDICSQKYFPKLPDPYKNLMTDNLCSLIDCLSEIVPQNFANSFNKIDLL